LTHDPKALASLEATCRSRKRSFRDEKLVGALRDESIGIPGQGLEIVQRFWRRECRAGGSRSRSGRKTVSESTTRSDGRECAGRDNGASECFILVVGRLFLPRGSRIIRRFIQLTAAHAPKVWLRIAPGRTMRPETGRPCVQARQTFLPHYVVGNSRTPGERRSKRYGAEPACVGYVARRRKPLRT